MATHKVVSWSGDEHTFSPNLSKTPSLISVDSILSDKSGASPSDQGPHMAESQPPHTAFQVIEPSGTTTSKSTTIYPGTDGADHDGSFMRHNKYFFKDGNVTFLVDNVLYCVHRYFFSRDSTYFATRFDQLDIHDHEPLPTIISLGDVESKDFDAFLSILYPEDFEGNQFSYEEWKSVLHLSTRWDFASIRRRALGSINPPTPHDLLLLARTYSVDEWVVPALSALCERTTPLSLSEARQMSIEDVVLVSTVREDIRSHALQVDSAEIPLRVEAEQLGALGLEIPVHLHFPKSKALSAVALKRVNAHEGDNELSAEEGAPGNMSVFKGKPVRPMKNSRGKAAAMRVVKTDTEASRINNIKTPRGHPEEDDDGVAIGFPLGTSRPESPASPVLRSYPVGRGISLPFGRSLPKCDWLGCSCNALIVWRSHSDINQNGVVCLDHGLRKELDDYPTRYLSLGYTSFRHEFISPEHEAAIRAFLA